MHFMNPELKLVGIQASYVFFFFRFYSAMVAISMHEPNTCLVQFKHTVQAINLDNKENGGNGSDM